MTAVQVKLSSLLRDAAENLRTAGVVDAMADARILAANALGLSREEMLREPHRDLDPAGQKVFEKMIARRWDREPVARILGQREFRSLSFRLASDTLEPRPDSETIVEAAVEYGERLPVSGLGPLRVLDIGTGTGCLLLAVLTELPGSTGVGTDIAGGAVETANRNAGDLGLSDRAVLIRTDWTDDVTGAFDLVLSNPPYIESAEIETLAPEVADHDPLAALDGGADGLDAYRAIAGRLAQFLSPAGVAVFEIGAMQRDAVAAIFAAQGFLLVETRDDFGGHPRALVFAAEPLPEWLTNTGKKGLETP